MGRGTRSWRGIEGIGQFELVVVVAAVEKFVGIVEIGRLEWSGRQVVVVIGTWSLARKTVSERAVVGTVVIVVVVPQ